MLANVGELCPAAQRAIAAVRPTFRPAAVVALPLPEVAGVPLRWELLESCGESPVGLSQFQAVRIPRRLPTYHREWAQPGAGSGGVAGQAPPGRRNPDGASIKRHHAAS